MLRIDSTALHSGKDFAVALPISLSGFIRPKPDAAFFRLRRHCSHLYPCGRRALPATLLPAEAGECSDFPHQSCPPQVVCKIESPIPIGAVPVSRYEPENGTLNFVAAYGGQNWRNYPTQRQKDYTTQNLLNQCIYTHSLIDIKTVLYYNKAYIFFALFV